MLCWLVDVEPTVVEVVAPGATVVAVVSVEPVVSVVSVVSVEPESDGGG